MATIPNANILTPAQISYYAQNAGFSGDDLAIAVAVAMAESGGNPVTYNPETAAKGGTPDGEGSYGLWQIYLKDHPEYTYSNLYDPQTNANAAHDVYSAAGGFHPWSTFNSGAYQAYLAPVAAPVPAIPGLTSTPATEASAAPSGFSMNEVLWIAGAAIVGIFIWGLFE